MKKMRKIKKIDNRSLISILIIIFACYTIYALVEQEVKIHHLNKKITAIRGYVAEEQAKQKSLLEEHEALGHDDYIEKVAREDLGLTKPGEIPYIPTHKKD